MIEKKAYDDFTIGTKEPITRSRVSTLKEYIALIAKGVGLVLKSTTIMEE